MVSRGIFQLKNIHLQFCDLGGVRLFLSSPLLREFLDKNPQIAFQAMMHRGHHPFLSATYLNGLIKDQTLRNYDEEAVYEEFMRVRNSMGHRAYRHAGKKVISTRDSIQGKWRPNLLGTFPRVEMEKPSPATLFEKEYQMVKRDKRPMEEKPVIHKDLIAEFLRDEPASRKM